MRSVARSEACGVVAGVGALGNRVDGHPVVADLAQQGHGRLEDRFLPNHAAAACRHVQPFERNVETGTGEPVVFLHGMPDSWFMWHHQMAALSDSYRCIAVDLKGYGQSGKDRGDYRQAGAAAQLVTLLDTIAVDQFVLVTHDRGTVQGDHIAAAHPARVRHYVRGEGHLYHFHPDLAPHDELLAEAPWTGLMEDPKRFVVWAYTLIGELPVADEDMRRVIQEFSYPGITRAVPRYSMASTFRKEWIERRRELIPRWRCPVTIVQGWDSRTQPREFFTDAAERIPHAARVEVRYVDGGHFWPLESPGQTSTVLREVLGAEPAPKH